ncbi:MAG: hypothetical protein M1834_003761 [Cirrosporium novae-zelandiae]|nr:MAG: hypothetical protein M1834_003761 [Cirrosporium novae-zelandiae]
MALSNPQVQMGPELHEISGFGFRSINRDVKLKLFPTPWPSDNLPHSTSSLLAIASQHGVLVAAGPDYVVVAETESIRDCLLKPGLTDDGERLPDIRSYTPKLSIPIPRVSRVAFTADEKYLLLSAESSSDLAVYELAALLNGNTQPTFQISTNNASLRTLAPNPASGLIAIVTSMGQLLLADLETRSLVNNGQVFKDGVSCVAWSNKGKQLVAGLGDGTLCQMKTDGSVVAEIPSPQGLQGEYHVSSVLWLQNDLFLVVHTPTRNNDPPDPSELHVINREPPSSYIFSHLPDPSPPFGLIRQPAHYFLSRLRKFPPDIEDMILAASTCSSDIGVLTRSAKALAQLDDVPTEEITNTFTVTSPGDDADRATLPMGENSTDTSPIGVALDLSSRMKVWKPIPTSDIEESPTPLPGLVVLNNEGTLAYWWVIYADSINKGMPYPGLIAVAGQLKEQVESTPAPTEPQKPTPSSTGFGGFGTPSTTPFSSFSQPSASTLGNTGTSAFGTKGGFGAASDMGKPQSPWGGGSAPGKPTFGAPSSFGSPSQTPAFGAHGLGQRQSPWGSTGSSTPAATLMNSGAAFGSHGFGQKQSPWGSQANNTRTPAFGQPSGLESQQAKNTLGGAFGGGNQTSGFGAEQPKNPFGGVFGGPSSPSASSTSGGFGSYATSGGFGRSKSLTEGGFGSSSKFQGEPLKAVDQKPANSFSKGSSFGGFAKPSNDSKASPKENGDAFGFGTGFSRGLSPTKSPKDTGGPFFENSFMGALMTAGDPKPAPDKEAEMEDSNTDQPKSPPSTLTAPRITSPLTAPPLTTGSWGAQAQAQQTPAAVQSSRPTIFQSTTPQETPLKLTSTPAVKPQLSEDTKKLSQIKEASPEPPLPPDSTSKSSLAPWDSSASSSLLTSRSPDDAPLPPDFLFAEKTPKTDAPLPPDYLPSSRSKASQIESFEAPLPEEEEVSEFDDEGSGEDITKDLSPPEPDQITKISLENSYGGSIPAGDFFSKIRRDHSRDSSKPLFGEITGKPAPIFSPPRSQLSPRSPSPVRAIPRDLIRPDNSRSMSAPGLSRSAIQQRKATLGRSAADFAKPSTGTSASNQLRIEREQLALVQARKQQEEEQNLSDQEDERVREELATEVEPSKALDPFVAHQDYIGQVSKPGVPGQIERLYRDINSMVDTLGINARTLRSFIKGHTELYKEGGRDRDDLEDEENWCLIEIEDLAVILKETAEQLESGRIHHVREKLNECKDLQNDLIKVRSKRQDIQKAINSVTDPEQLEAMRIAPLSAEQTTVQNDLRKDFTQLQRWLVEAEEGITMLRTQLASSSNGSSNGVRRTPTVEAVTNTIMKMTSMAEKRSGDIDVLENQMRKLGVGSPLNGPMPRSREGSPLATPRSSRTKVQQTPRSNSTAAFYTPELKRSVGLGRNGFGSSVGSNVNGTPRRRLHAVSEDDMKAYQEKAQRRKLKLEKLGQALVEAGPMVRKLNEA